MPKLPEHYNVIYIGSGPATVFSVLEHPKENSLIIEKGKGMATRSKKEVVFGFGGAGTYSDSKLICYGRSVNVAKHIDFDKYADVVLKWYNYFDEKGDMTWKEPDPYEVPWGWLKLIKSKNFHVGTDRSQGIFERIEKYISEKICPIHFEEEVTSIELNRDRIYKFIVTTNKDTYVTKKIVLATGCRDKLLVPILERYNLPKQPTHLQIGVRFETTDEYFRDLIDKFYDFKLSMEVPLGRYRTFCVNAGTAHVVPERDGNYVSANGHAYSQKEPNHMVNFALLGQLNIAMSIEDQIKLAKGVNAGTNLLLAQNLDDFLGKRATTELKLPSSVSPSDYRCGNLWDVLRNDICENLEIFIREIQKQFPMEGHFFAPEINLVHPTVQLKPTFELVDDFYVIGDVAITRSIVDAGVSGIIAGESL